MWIKNSASYGSIAPFDRIELPNLTVIIGLNGAGKTQLLNGIREGAIESPFKKAAVASNLAAENPDIVLLKGEDGNLAGLNPGGASNVHNLLLSSQQPSDYAAFVEDILALQKAERENIENRIKRESGKSFSDLGVSWSRLPFLNLNPGLSDQLTRDALNPDLLRKELNEAGRRIVEFMELNQIKDPSQRIAHSLPDTGLPEQALEWDRKSVSNRVGWPYTPLFTPNIVNIFRRYRDTRWLNQVQRAADTDDGTNLALTPAEFEAKHGKPPWERVNNALGNFGLPYTVAPIKTDPSVSVEFRLFHKNGSVALGHDNLSSGEKVLFRLVLASFQANLETNYIRFPKLALLDELDASLHPENVRRWLNAIQEGYVDGFGIPCILTTHSPTTVALAPDDAIFEMSADDPRPRPIGKQAALNCLTAGLPMLSIDYSARRQVFTESNIDVDHFTMLHDLMRLRLNLPRTLSFIGTGTRGGCTFVYDMVHHMEVNGNRSVFGIVDWDLSNKPTSRVRVLAEGSHYAKDNVILDPLLVGALLIKNDELSIFPRVRFSDLLEADEATLQRVSDAVVSKIIWPAAAGMEIELNHYYDGTKLTVRKVYKRRQGHDLEAAIKQAFPMLVRHKAEGELATKIIQRVIGDLPNLCPKPITDLFISLASDNS